MPRDNLVSQPPLTSPMTDGNGTLTKHWAIWFRDVYNRIGFRGGNAIDDTVALVESEQGMGQQAKAGNSRENAQISAVKRDIRRIDSMQQKSVLSRLLGVVQSLSRSISELRAITASYSARLNNVLGFATRISKRLSTPPYGSLYDTADSALIVAAATDVTIPFSLEADSQELTVDTAEDEIEFISGGIAAVIYTATLSASADDTTVQIQPERFDAATSAWILVTGATSEAFLNVSGQAATLSSSLYVNVSKGDKIRLRIRHDQAGSETITVGIRNFGVKL